METLLPILIQLLGGAAGGNVIAAALKNLDLNKVVATIAGVLGGVGAGQIAPYVEVLQQVLGGDGGAAVAGNAGVGAGGGAIVALIIGLVKQMLAKKPA